MGDLKDTAQAARDIADRMPQIGQAVGVLLALQVLACLGIVYVLARGRG